MQRAELMRRMWARVEMCRRLAITTTDPHTADALIQMANEGEADIHQLTAEPDHHSPLAPPLDGQGAHD